MDQNKVWEVLCVPVDKPLIAIVVDKHVLVDVQVVLETRNLLDDGLCRSDQCVLRRLVLLGGLDVAAVDCFRCRAAEVAGQAKDLVLGELWKMDE